MDFEVRVREIAPDIRCVEVKGDLDIDTVPAMRALLDDQVDEGARRVLVHLADPYYVDSTGIALLLEATERLADQGGRLAVRCNGPRIRRVFEIMRLPIPLVESEEGARAALEVGGQAPAG